ncbi:MAG: two-component system sensor histidine kinase NtrB [Treponemataceae bacterium]
MSDFVKKATQKLEKLTPFQVKQLVENILNQNESLYSLVQSLTVGLVICSNEWQIILANKAAERMVIAKSRYFEYKSQDAVPVDKVWDFIEDEDIAEFIKKASTEKKINNSKEFVLKQTGAKPKFYTVSIESLVHHQEKKLKGSIIKIEDITEKRNSEMLIRRMENLSSLTNLAASVAHEIKNPLGSMSIYIQLLQKSVAKSRSTDGVLPAEKFMENYLEVINQEINRLNKIVVDFLFAVRPIQAELLAEDPNAILEKIMEFYKPEFEQKNVLLETDFSSHSAKILLDEKLFKQVVINIIQNSFSALESIQENTLNKKSKISVKTELKNDKFLIFICDNGIGMDEETKTKIFDPYFTTKTTGTGLGLTMVYKIIKEFAGDIDVESELGFGTTFRISLPVMQNEKKLLGEPK